MQDTLSIFKTIEVEKPVDVIIAQIRDLISAGRLKPGDRLPSERMLSERIGLGRTYVREAIKKLEFYGILKTLPQSGTVVAGIGISALEGLISNILKIDKSDFAGLLETRIVLGMEAVKRAAIRRTETDLHRIKEALEVYRKLAERGEAAVEEDFMFHLRIIEAAKNPVIKSLLMLIIPQIIEFYNKMDICAEAEAMKAYREHLNIYEAIKAQDAHAAAELMEQHFEKIIKTVKTLKQQN